jgi:predicted small secreted protein
MPVRCRDPGVTVCHIGSLTITNLKKRPYCLSLSLSLSLGDQPLYARVMQLKTDVPMASLTRAQPRNTNIGIVCMPRQSSAKSHHDSVATSHLFVFTCFKHTVGLPSLDSTRSTATAACPNTASGCAHFRSGCNASRQLRKAGSDF